MSEKTLRYTATNVVRGTLKTVTGAVFMIAAIGAVELYNDLNVLYIQSLSSSPIPSGAGGADELTLVLGLALSAIFTSVYLVGSGILTILKKE